MVAVPTAFRRHNGVAKCVDEALPYVGLAVGASGLAAKVIGLLWMVFLVAGPTAAGMQSYLSIVVSLTTDWGHESKIWCLPDLVPLFLSELLCDDTLAPVDPSSRLLPNCTWAPGWNHLCSNILKIGLNTIPGIVRGAPGEIARPPIQNPERAGPGPRGLGP